MMKIIAEKYISRILIIAVLFFLYTPFHAQAFTASEVEDNLMCYSCSGEALNKCRSGCGDHMRQTIKKMMKEGKTKDEILAYYVGQHGEIILTLPPKRGFNLVAYIAPFVGLFIGVGVAFFLVKKWGLSAETGGTDMGDAALSSEMQEKIDDELSKLEEDD